MSDRTIAKIGQMLGVKYVAVANLQEVFSELYADARLIDVETGEIMVSTNSSSAVGSLQELVALAEKIANALTGRANAVGGQSYGSVAAPGAGGDVETFTVNGVTFEMVSWTECQAFCERLRQLTGHQFRLPTEAEWEYVARGGNHSRGYKYSGGNDLYYLGWYTDNSGNTPHPVGTKQANELGIYDMSGNVWEWTSDLWSDNYSSYRNGGSDSSWRVSRGGYCGNEARYCRWASRSYCGLYDTGSIGLRLAF